MEVRLEVFEILAAIGGFTEAADGALDVLAGLMGARTLRSEEVTGKVEQLAPHLRCGEAEELAQHMREVAVSFTRKVGEHGNLFGSVTAIDVAEKLASQGYRIDRRKIQLSSPLKVLGEYDVPVKLHREVTATIKVKVEPEGGVQPAATPETSAEASPPAAPEAAPSAPEVPGS